MYRIQYAMLSTELAIQRLWNAMFVFSVRVSRLNKVPTEEGLEM